MQSLQTRNTAKQGIYAAVIAIGAFIALQSAGINGGDASPFGIGMGIGVALVGIYSWARNLYASARRGGGNSVEFYLRPRTTADGVVMAVMLIGSPLLGLLIGAL